MGGGGLHQCQDCHILMYCIAGKFGGEFGGLADW